MQNVRLHTPLHDTHAVSFGFGQGLAVVPAIVLDPITCNGRTGAVFAAAAMKKNRVLAVLEEQRQNALHLFLCRRGERAERYVDVLHAQLLYLFFFEFRVFARFSQVDHHLHAECADLLQADRSGHAAPVQMIVDAIEIADVDYREFRCSAKAGEASGNCRHSEERKDSGVF